MVDYTLNCFIAEIFKDMLTIPHLVTCWCEFHV